jgi:hypothetical protein
MDEVDKEKSTPCGMLEESPGVRSSKRVWGTIILTLACLIAAGSVVLSYAFGRDSSTAVEVMKTMFIAGTSLLGLGVAEGWFKGRPQ